MQTIAVPVPGAEDGGTMQVMAPQVPPQALMSFSILAPAETHFRPATCEETRCAHFLLGWTSVADESTDHGQEMAHYIRRNSGRKFTEQRLPTGVTAFEFEAGQRCFKAADHKLRIEDRPEIYIARGGDWRGNPTGEHTRHANADDWVDQFANNQDKVAERIARG